MLSNLDSRRPSLNAVRSAQMVDGRKATLAMVWRSGLLLLLAGLLNYVDGQCKCTSQGLK